MGGEKKVQEIELKDLSAAGQQECKIFGNILQEAKALIERNQSIKGTDKSSLITQFREGLIEAENALEDVTDSVLTDEQVQNALGEINHCVMSGLKNENTNREFIDNFLKELAIEKKIRSNWMRNFYQQQIEQLKIEVEMISQGAEISSINKAFLEAKIQLLQDATEYLENYLGRDNSSAITGERNETTDQITAEKLNSALALVACAPEDFQKHFHEFTNNERRLLVFKKSSQKFGQILKSAKENIQDFFNSKASEEKNKQVNFQSGIYNFNSKEVLTNFIASAAMLGIAIPETAFSKVIFGGESIIQLNITDDIAKQLNEKAGVNIAHSVQVRKDEMPEVPQNPEETNPEETNPNDIQFIPLGEPEENANQNIVNANLFSEQNLPKIANYLKTQVEKAGWSTDPNDITSTNVKESGKINVVVSKNEDGARQAGFTITNDGISIPQEIDDAYKPASYEAAAGVLKQAGFSLVEISAPNNDIDALADAFEAGLQVGVISFVSPTSDVNYDLDQAVRKKVEQRNPTLYAQRYKLDKLSDKNKACYDRVSADHYRGKSLITEVTAENDNLDELSRKAAQALKNGLTPCVMSTKKNPSFNVHKAVLNHIKEKNKELYNVYLNTPKKDREILQGKLQGCYGNAPKNALHLSSKKLKYVAKREDLTKVKSGAVPINDLLFKTKFREHFVNEKGELERTCPSLYHYLVAKAIQERGVLTPEHLEKIYRMSPKELDKLRWGHNITNEKMFASENFFKGLDHLLKDPDNQYLIDELQEQAKLSGDTNPYILFFEDKKNATKNKKQLGMLKVNSQNYEGKNLCGQLLQAYITPRGEEQSSRLEQLAEKISKREDNNNRNRQQPGM